MNPSAKNARITAEDAYAMGYRHIADLARINQVAEMIRGDHPDAEALRLLAAWREGAMVAQAMLDRARTTLQ
jgi:hypothetical protein